MDLNIQLPNKLTFKRNEVVKIAKLDGKVLDYWENEFGGFKPIVNKMGEVFYSRTDVEFILKIKYWMIVERIGKNKVKERVLEERPHDERHQQRHQQISEKNVQEPCRKPEDEGNNDRVDDQTNGKKNRNLKQHKTAAQKTNNEASSRNQQAEFPRGKLKIIRKNLLEILTILEKNDKK
jgi:DNA-binding transcriptional MerR regulator